MKKLFFVAALFLPSAGAWAQSAGQAGVGVNVGDPMGLTGKYWLDHTRAVDVGASFAGDLALYGDFLWNAWDIFPQPKKGRLDAYVGLGPRLELTDDNDFGIRTVAGAAYWIENHPIEVYLEAGPVFQVIPNQRVDFDASLGVRFYFSAANK